jgi:hypothetical protein
MLSRSIRALVLALFVGGTTSIANADIEPAVNLCVSTADASGILDVLSTDTNEHVSDLIGQSVQIRATSSGYEIEAAGKSSSSLSHYPPPTEARRGPCTAFGPTSSVLRGTTIIPGDIFAAYNAVLTFRKTFMWPRGVADISDLTTEVRFTKYADYAGVSIMPAPKQPQLGCLGETYRVDLPSLTIRPYDGCIEAHPPSGLPHFNELPPPNSPS